MKRASAARGGQGAGIMQPRDHSLADPCTKIFVPIPCAGFRLCKSFSYFWPGAIFCCRLVLITSLAAAYTSPRRRPPSWPPPDGGQQKLAIMSAARQITHTATRRFLLLHSFLLSRLKSRLTRLGIGAGVFEGGEIRVSKLPPLLNRP